MTAAYSGTPLAKKLGFKAGSRVRIMGAPEAYATLLEPLPEGVQFMSELSVDTDIVHLFTDQKAVLQLWLTACRTHLRPTATVWVSWPKKASKVPTDITEDVVREVALPLGWVDVKVCAVNEVWSGLKLVVRQALR